jgi:hypothetical protein
METTEKSIGRIEPMVVPLYEYSVLLSVHVVVAANTEDSAMKRIKMLSPEAVAKIGDVVAVSDIYLFDRRECSVDDVEDLAHLTTAL